MKMRVFKTLVMILIIVFTLSKTEIAVMAAENDGHEVIADMNVGEQTDEAEVQGEPSEQNRSEEQGKLEDKSEQKEQEALYTQGGEADSDSEEANVDECFLSEYSDITSLQIPQKLQIVIDPWEMDGKGQIYSEKYIIKNTGKVTGMLQLSELSYRANPGCGVIIQRDASGIHECIDKAVYMEIVFVNGNGEENRVILSDENAEYMVELEPEEELSFFFSGEVNENASENWRGDDISVTMVYSWEGISPTLENDEQKIKTDSNTVGNVKENYFAESGAIDKESSNADESDNDEEKESSDAERIDERNKESDIADNNEKIEKPAMENGDRTFGTIEEFGTDEYGNESNLK